MGMIIQYTVNATGNPEAVIAQTVCDEIEVGEDPSVTDWPTLAYKVRKPDMTSTPRQKPAGTTYTFRKPLPNCFQPGEIVGYLETTSGSTTFFQDEKMSQPR